MAWTLKKMLIFPAWSPKLVRQKKLCSWDIPAGKFWCCFRAHFPNLAKKAFEVLVLFVTTYRCEQSFSVMIVVKKKQAAQSLGGNVST